MPFGWANSPVLYNFKLRGFRFHAGKAQLLADKIHLVGCYVDAKGSTPPPNEGSFEALKQRNHTNIKAVQKTLGSLQWFSRFLCPTSRISLDI